MTSKNIIRNYSVILIACAYFIFSCAYIIKCRKVNDGFTYSQQKAAAATVKAKANPTSDSGRFLSRPRVISNDNKFTSVAAAIVILSFLFVAFHHKSAYHLPFSTDSKSLYFSNLIVFLGNRRI